MGINHCCTHIAVAKKFLDCPYIVSVFQQVSCKRMTKGVTTCVFIDATSKMAYFMARCISDSSKCHLPSSPVWIFFHLFFCGKSHCHLNSLLPPWYLSERAWGSFTDPKPVFKFSSWIFRKFSIWDSNSQIIV